MLKNLILAIFLVTIFSGCGEFLNVLLHNDEEIVGAFVFDLSSPIAVLVKRAGEVGEVEILTDPLLVGKVRQEVPFVFFASPWPKAQGGRFPISSPITAWRGSVNRLSGMGISSQGASVRLILEAQDNGVVWEVRFNK